MTINIDTLFKNSDPIIADILNNALSDKEISVKEGIELYNVNDVDFHLVGLVANEIRRRRACRDKRKTNNYLQKFRNV